MSLVWSFSATSLTCAAPLAKPAGPPWPSKASEYEVGGLMSESDRRPRNLADTGPILATISTWYSFGLTRVIDSQPGTQALSTSGSLSASQVSFWDAGMSCSPVISTAEFPYSWDD